MPLSPQLKTLAAAVLLAAACKPSPPAGALVVGSVAVSEAGLAGKPEIGGSAEQLRKELQQVLESTGRFVVREGGPVQVRMEIERAQRTLAPQPVVEGGLAAPEREMAEVGVSMEMTCTACWRKARLAGPPTRTTPWTPPPGTPRSTPQSTRPCARRCTRSRTRSK